MFFKNFDYISKRNHFYYKGHDRHKNVPSGIITIISYSAILYFSIILLYNMITKKTFTSFQSKSSLSTDDENISISLDPRDKNFFFHYLYIDNNYSTEGLIQIIGAFSTDNYYIGYGPIKYGEEKKLDIYYYEPCDESDMYNYDEKIKNKQIFFKSFCIKKMYKYSENKIILKNDTNFVWPKLNKWFEDKLPVYSIFVRKCIPFDEHTNLTYICKTNEEIDAYFMKNNIKLNLYFIEYLPNVKDYRNPVEPRIISFEVYTLTNGYPEGIIHSDLTRVVTREGLFNHISKEELIFSYNSVQYAEIYGNIYNLKGIFIIFKDSILNEYYRTYDDISLVISKIGGINSSIILVAKFISIIFVKFSHYIDSIDIYREIKKSFQKNNIKKSFLKKSNIIDQTSFFKNKNMKSLFPIDNYNITLKNNASYFKKNNTLQNKFIKNSENINYNSYLNSITNKKKGSRDKIITKKINFFKFIYLYLITFMNKKKLKEYKDLNIYYLRKIIINEEFIFTLYLKDKINDDEFNNNQQISMSSFPLYNPT